VSLLGPTSSKGGGKKDGQKKEPIVTSFYKGESVQVGGGKQENPGPTGNGPGETTKGNATRNARRTRGFNDQTGPKGRKKARVSQ